MRRVIIVFVLLVLALGVSIYAQAELPAPTGPYAVGRTAVAWIDESRDETATPDPGDRREVPVAIWYPAVTGTGEASPYFPGLAAVRDALRDSGEVSGLEVFGLPLVRSRERANAELAGNPELFPLVILSPGNGTNVEFYAALADDLASNGYVVVGINHAYDVAAVMLSNGTVASFVSSFGRGPEYLSARVDERAKDISFVLDRLQALATGPGELAPRLDFSRVAAIGHSLGGIAAAEACSADPRFRACGNLDGLQAGGPFAVVDLVTGPDAPFLFLTKKAELSQPLVRLFEERVGPTYAVLLDGAEHDSFTDGPLLMPSLLPLRGQADRNQELIRRTLLAFLSAALDGRPPVLGEEGGLRVRVFGAPERDQPG